MNACSDFINPSGEGFATTAISNLEQISADSSEDFATGLPDSRTEEKCSVATDKVSAVGSLSESIKAILINSKSVPELHEAVRSADTNGEVTDIKITQYLKGPKVSSGELTDGMVILVYFKESWVRCIRPSSVITSAEYALYGEENLHGRLGSIVNSANSVDELLKLLADYDSFGWIGEITVYRNAYDLSEGKICITGELVVGARVFVSVRTASGSYVEWEFRKHY